MNRCVYGKRGLLVRLTYLAIALLWHVMTIFGRFYAGKLVLLCYHGVSERNGKRFRRQMKHITLSAASLEGTKKGKTVRWSLPRVGITFDDAFANLLDNALPVLEQYRIPAIVFAVADNLGKRPCWEMPAGDPDSNENTMTSRQLADLSKHSLVKIGAHTLTHPDLTKIPTDQIKSELTDSKEQLAELLGCPVEELALPYGGYNEEVLALAKEAGYKKIYTLDPKQAHLASENPVLGRFSMSPDVWRIEFMLTCAGAYAWLYPWRAGLASIRRKIGRRDHPK